MDATQVPIGMIIEVHGLVEVECAALPPLHQALYATNDGETFLFQVCQQLDARHVRAITLPYTSGLERGVPVYDTNAPLHVLVTQDCLGRALDSFGTWPPDAVEWPTLGLPTDYLPLIAGNRKAFVKAGDRIVCDGGISIKEVLVPFVEIG
jgi:F-type H+-transporting ATPase subunit beta